MQGRSVGGGLTPGEGEAGAGRIVALGADGATGGVEAEDGLGGGDPLSCDQLVPSHAQSAFETGADVLEIAPEDPEPGGVAGTPSAIPPKSRTRLESGS